MVVPTWQMWNTKYVYYWDENFFAHVNYLTKRLLKVKHEYTFLNNIIFIVKTKNRYKNKNGNWIFKIYIQNIKLNINYYFDSEHGEPQVICLIIFCINILSYYDLCLLFILLYIVRGYWFWWLLKDHTTQKTYYVLLPTYYC